MQRGKHPPENRRGQWRHHVRDGESTLPSLSFLKCPASPASGFGSEACTSHSDRGAFLRTAIATKGGHYETNTGGSFFLPPHPGDAHRAMRLGNHGSSWDAGHTKDRHSPIPIAQVYWTLYRVMKDETHLVSFSSSSLPKGIVACILGQENSTLKTDLWKAEKSSYCLPMDFSMVSSWSGFSFW